MSFDAAKTSLLGKLAAGVDFSPKGSIDAPIVQLVDFINDLPDFVTTSSCSGRISVYRDENCTKGVVWILVVHGVITVEQLRKAVEGQDCDTAGNFFIALKCEGFIVHIRCRDLDSGRKLHQIAMSCGFRESGLSVGQKMRVQLAIRTTAYGLELPIAVDRKMILDTNALEIIVAEANRRLRCNFARTDRLLLAMKREYSWPSMVCSPFPGSHIRRWGHTCTSDADGHHMVLGGYGVEGDYSDNGGVASRSQSQLSTRKLSNMILLEEGTPRPFNLLDTKSESVSFMHAESATLQLEGLSLLIVSGGRESPLLALNCLRVYSNPLKKEIKNSQLSDFMAVGFNEYGDIPSPRWGHTLTALGKGSRTFLLYGGRDERQVFGDAYLLVASTEQPSSTSSENSTTLVFTWRKISTPGPTDGVSESVMPSPRFFHAACCISVTDDCDSSSSSDSSSDSKEGTDSNSLDSDLSRVLIHGGLLSLDDPVSCSRAYIFNAHTLEWCPFQNTASVKSKDTSLALALAHEEHGEDTASYAFSEHQMASTDHGTEEHLPKVTVSAGPPDVVKRSNAFIHKFGHTITDIGCKSLVIAGGVSFDDTEVGSSSDHDNAFKGMCIIDLMMSDDARLCGALRGALLLPAGHQWSDNSTAAGSGSGSGSGSETAAESGTEQSALPCRDCRSHHRAVYDRNKKTLHLLGGGALCMSFGAHYCHSVSLQLCSGTAPGSHIPSNTGTSQGIFEKDQETVSVNVVPSDISKEAAVVLLVPVSRVKLVKSFLEKEGTCWLDKKRRITVSEVTDAAVKFIPILKTFVSKNDFRAFDEKNRVEKEKEKALSDVKKAAVDLLVGATEGKVQNKKRGEDAAGSLMAVPVMPSFADILFKGLQCLSDSQRRDFCLCFGEAYFMKDNTIRDMGDDKAVTLCLKVGMQSVKASKTVLASGYRKADEYLDGVMRDYHLAAVAAASFPRKYEIVGNVLMIPEDSLQGPVWDVILPPPHSVPVHAPFSSALLMPGAVPVSTSALEKRSIRIWTGLAACFGVSKVARKARVDSGPKRESRVQLLLPAVGQPAETGPGAPGWVEVLENSISYGFDITRVMFCSGNCTERIRMGKEVVRGEVIVDLYCGVGYYTIPFLLHGKASHVHACEWNTNSLLAIRENLRKAGSDVTSRCTVYAGDNNVTALLLPSIADRVCLGLLPSSVGGWPLAVCVLKPTGGTLHVHENVRDTEVESWTATTCAYFEEKLAAAGKPLRVICRHTERVKSYAPHILHIVVDLICTPT